ncbi:MAG: hypothetical protein NDJ94_22025 [Vicinamibacteria bacterium]|nr:hypothetical protein [Vicinamibacteria bacterium]
MTVLLAAPTLALALAVAPATPGPAAVLGAAEEFYARRAEGSAGPDCAPGNIEAAVGAYRQAIALDADSLAARRGFLRAVFFRVGFCPGEPGSMAPLFDEAKRIGDETVKRLEAGRSGSRKEKLTTALRADPLAAEVFLWTAAAWGQWAVHHKIAAAWQGTAGKMRDLVEVVNVVAPQTLDGGGYLILGRLHTEAPKIPFLTGWVSKQKGIAAMREGLKFLPHGKNHLFFLGAALVEHEPKAREEGLALLRRCAETPASPQNVVEDRHYMDKASRLLATLGATTSIP